MKNQYFNEDVEKYLLTVEQREKYTILKSIGLVEKEYSDRKSKAYPLRDKSNGRYYREVPIQVTDEEWFEIKRAYEADQKLRNSNSRKNEKYSSSFIGTILGLFGLLAIIGGILIAISIPKDILPFLKPVIILYSIIIGVIIYAYGDIVDYLKQIRDKL